MTSRHIATVGLVLALAVVTFFIARHNLLPAQNPPAKAGDEQPRPKAPKRWLLPRISHFEIQAGADGKELLTPGFWDEDTETFYRWKGIAFPDENLPFKNTPYRREWRTLDPRKEKYRQVDFDPPISYLTLAPEKLAPGYHVSNVKAFYQWKEATLKPSELPPPKEDWPVVISEKDRATTVVIVVPPPKHLLDKTDSWKKAENKK